VEICKLRLFLKLVAQIERAEQIEPLPDIDFNIRAGNTLVGFATYEEVQQAITTRPSDGQIKMLSSEDESTMARIEAAAQDVDRLFQAFRQQQTTLGGAVTPEDKHELRRRLDGLNDELNHYLAAEYGVEMKKRGAYAQWLATHQPFHWFVEFYGIMQRGGFDVIIGNPPYVEYRKVKSQYTVRDYATERCGNLYVFSMERSKKLLTDVGRMGLIVPIALVSVSDVVEIRNLLLNHFHVAWMSNFAIRPAKLFEGVEQRLTIYISTPSNQERQVFTSKYHQWYVDERPNLLQRIEYANVIDLVSPASIPKASNAVIASIVRKVQNFNGKVVADYLTKSKGVNLYFHRTPGYWIRMMDFEPYFKSPTQTRSIHHIRELSIANAAMAKFIGAVVSSSLYFLYFFAVGNCRNLTLDDVRSFPIGQPSSSFNQEIGVLFDKLMVDYKRNSVINYRGSTEFQEFNWGKSKPIIDEIDRALAQHYGFTAEELDFIINYDIKYRMGRDGGAGG
jgi:hypothetical protein